jgi:hypothetical protein
VPDLRTADHRAFDQSHVFREVFKFVWAHQLR